MGSTDGLARELCDENPRVLVEEVRDAGHGLPFDQPERLAEAVASFLRDLA
jgi:N-formylmaleamate deformylase